MGIGIKVIFKDETTQDFDPVDDETSVKTTIYVTEGNSYTFNHFDIDTIYTYDICETCGYEVRQNGKCTNYRCKTHES